MAEEKEAEHVRMMQAGHVTVDLDATIRKEFKHVNVLEYSNRFGVSFVATSSGIGVSEIKTLEESFTKYDQDLVEAKNSGEPPSGPKKVEFIRELSIPKVYNLSIGLDDKLLAIAHGSFISVYEVARILAEENAQPISKLAISSKLVQMQWSNSIAALLVVNEKEKLVIYDMNLKQKAGYRDPVTTASWSADGTQIAAGFSDGNLRVLDSENLSQVSVISRPEELPNGYFVSYIYWAETQLYFVGFKQVKDEEEDVISYLNDSESWIDLESFPAFFPGEGDDTHDFYVAFIPTWRMFFVGCTLSTDIELLVFDDEWQIWKPLEKYTARMPMQKKKKEDFDTFPLGIKLVLNSTRRIMTNDLEDSFFPAPLLLGVNTNGLLLNFTFIDETVYEEVDFLRVPEEFPLPQYPTNIASVPEDLEDRGGYGQDDKNTVADNEGSDDKEAAREEDTSVPEDLEDRGGYGQDDVNTFADNEGSDDNEADREEERENAAGFFDQIDDQSTGFINESDFERIIVLAGSTYCEANHKPLGKKLSRNGKIERKTFCEWYADWVCGEDDEESDEEQVVAVEESTTTSNPWGKFLPKEGTWKCEVCCVSGQDPNAAQCVSCESPNPSMPKNAPTDTSSVAAGGFSSGFTFGVTAGADSAATTGFGTPQGTGFSFGGKPVTPDAGAQTPATTTGFTFTPQPGTGFSFGGKPATPNAGAQTPATSTGFTFTPQPGTGFSFGGKPATPGVGAQTPAADVKAKEIEKEDSGYGKNDSNTFADDDDDGDTEEERAQERASAVDAFDKVDVQKTGSIAVSSFEALLTACGTTYCEEEHKKTIAKLAVNGKIEKNAFADWYCEWIMSDFEEDLVSDTDLSTAKEGESSGKSFFASFKPKEGSWKCEVCMIQNEKEARQCASCESPNPNAPASAAEGAIENTPAASTGGFTFGIPSGITFGSTPTTTQGSKFGQGSSTFSGGFGFTPTGDTKGLTFGGFGSFGSAGKDATTTKSFNFSTPSQAQDTGKNKMPPVFGAPSPSGAYPPDTSKKDPVAAPGVPKKSSSAYPPDTSKKDPVAAPAVPKKSSSAYPPDTSKKDPVAAPGVPKKSSSAYPPDTSKKDPVAAPGVPKKSSSAYPPDTSKKQPVAAPGFPKQPSLKSPAAPSVFGGYSSKSKPTGSASFGGGFASTSGKPTPSFGGFAAAASKPADSASVGGSFGSTSAKPKPTTKTAPGGSTSRPSISPPADVSSASVEMGKPATALVGQVWTLLVNFHKQLEKIRALADKLKESKSSEMKNGIDELLKDTDILNSKLNALRKQQDEVKDATAVILGTITDVHTQLEYSERNLRNYENSDLQAIIKSVPLDDRSADTQKAIRAMHAEVVKCVADVERHLELAKRNANSVDRQPRATSAGLIKVVKQTYESSKKKHEATCDLLSSLERLSLRCRREEAVVVKKPAVRSTAEIVKALVEARERSKRQAAVYLDGCGKVLKPRELFLTISISEPTKKITPVRMRPTTASSKLMPSPKISVASPTGTTSKPLHPALSFKKPEPKKVEPRPTITAPRVDSTQVRQVSKRPSPALKPVADTPPAAPVPDVKKPPSSAPTGNLFSKVNTSTSVSKPPATSVAPTATSKDAAESSKRKTSPVSGFSFGNMAAATEEADKKSVAKNLFGSSGTTSIPATTSSGVSSPFGSAKSSGTSVASTTTSSVFSTTPSLKLPGPATTSSGTSSPFGKSAFATAATGNSAFSTSGTPGGFGQATPSFPSSGTDYRSRLVAFYQQHNPSKLGDVDATLAKYRGSEEALFAKLAKKYKVPQVNTSAPVSSPFGAAKAAGPVSSPFGAAKSTAAPVSSPFGVAKSTAPSFGNSTPVASPFGGSNSGGFGQTSGFGTKPSPFGQAPAAPAFGSATTSFGQSSSPSPFGGSSGTTPAFGSTTSLGGGGGFGGNSGGVNYRELLVQFYQQHNPTKLSEVDKTLAKYRGKEQQLFANLGKKYNVPVPGGLGGAVRPPGQASFGQASNLGAAPVFGNPSMPSFGGSSGGGFGAPQQQSSGGGFQQFSSSQTATFGGATNNTGGFGGSSGAKSFSGSSFTQMR